MLHCKAVTELSNIGVGIPTTLHHAADAKFACRRRATILAYQFRKFFDARCCRKALRHATAFRTTHRRNEDFIAKVVVLRHEILLQSLTVNLVRNRASALTGPQLVLAKQLICSCLKHCLVLALRILTSENHCVVLFGLDETHSSCPHHVAHAHFACYALVSEHISTIFALNRIGQPFLSK